MISRILRSLLMLVVAICLRNSSSAQAFTPLALGPGVVRDLNERGTVVGHTEGQLAAGFVFLNGTRIELGLGVHATDVNDSDVVTGLDISSGQSRAFVWRSGVFTHLATLGGPGAMPEAINSSGAIVGMSDTTPFGQSHAAMWRGNDVIDLGVLDGTSSFAVDINDFDQVIGVSDKANDGRAFLWQNGVMIDLGTFGGQSSEALDINNRGEIVGWAHDADDLNRAFLWRNGVLINIGPEGVHSVATHINEQGVALVESELGAFLWDNGQVTFIGESTAAWGLNDFGAVVGFYAVDDVEPHAMYWENGTITELADELSWAEFINNSGAVAGQTFDADGNSYAVLWIQTLFQVQKLYEETKAVKSGSTMPLKIVVTDSAGTNVSSPDLSVVADSLNLASSAISGDLMAATNETPDLNFRYSSDLGTSGGYIFNLRTRGLTTGTYELGIFISGERHVIRFQVK